MSDFLKKYKIQTIISVYIVAVILAFYFIGMPIVDKISVKANEIQQKKIEIESNEKRLADVLIMEEDYSKFKDNAENLDIIIEPNSEVDLIKELELMAEETGNKIEFQIQDIKAIKSVVKKKGAEIDIKSKLAYPNYLSMKIAIEGDYDSMLNFINKIENYKKAINIISISSEKKNLIDRDNPNPFIASTRIGNGSVGGEVINSIFDVVVYIKK